MAVLPCRAEEDVEAGSAALRVDWPVYPRRAEHNTVAEGGNRRWAKTARRPVGLVELADDPEDRVRPAQQDRQRRVHRSQQDGGLKAANREIQRRSRVDPPRLASHARRFGAKFGRSHLRPTAEPPQIVAPSSPGGRFGIGWGHPTPGGPKAVLAEHVSALAARRARNLRTSAISVARLRPAPGPGRPRRDRLAFHRTRTPRKAASDARRPAQRRSIVLITIGPIFPRSAKGHRSGRSTVVVSKSCHRDVVQRSPWLSKAGYVGEIVAKHDWPQRSRPLEEQHKQNAHEHSG
jgi:hypothetical protein